MRASAILFALIFAFTAFAASATQVRFTGIYSDLHYHQESGDLLGTEIFIFRSADGLQALVQAAEGELGAAVIVPVTVDGKKATLSFSVPEPSHGAGSYEGHFTSEGFVGIVKVKGSGGYWIERPFKLPRKNSYWQ